MEYFKGVVGISFYFYDIVSSGRFGTMFYLCRVLVIILFIFVDKDVNVDCVVF